MWSPDGKRIAFFRSGAQQLFVINPDGTGETIITQFNPVFSYSVAWSPDSRRLAYLRGFQTTPAGHYTEIFSRKLEDSAEHQITFDKKIIDDFCWTSTGEIVFNSNRGGGVGLWVIPEEGGMPKQLTLGAGTDGVPRISKDAKHLVYLNESESANLWTINLQTADLQQLTFEDAWVRTVEYSPDGSKLLYRLENEFEPSQDGFVICNMDGSDPTKFAPTIEKYTLMPYLSVFWSPDMKSFFFNGCRRDTIRTNPDSIVVTYSHFEYELATKTTRKTGDGALLDISRDGRTIVYALEDVHRAVLASKSTPDKKIMDIVIHEDDAMPRFSWDSKSVLIQDSMGLWSIPLDASKSKQRIKTPKTFWLIGPMPDDKSILGCVVDAATQRNTLVKVNIANGTVEEIRKIPGRIAVISPDGKTLTFIRVEIKNRIIVLDNFR